MDNKGFTLFDWLKQITYGKKPWSSFTETEKESFNSFMVHKYISMCQEYIEIVNYGQRIPYSDKEKTYKFYCSMLPKKNVFFNYVKGSRKKTNEAILKHIAEHFIVSLGEAEDYIYLLKKEGIADILTRRGIDDKEIKKLLKDIK